MVERTTTGLGNRVTYAGMDALDEKARRAVEGTNSRRVDWSQVYRDYTEAARHTAYASAKGSLCLKLRARNLWIAT